MAYTYVGFSPACPRPLAESLALHVASLHGIGAVIVPSETAEDRARVYQLIHGDAQTEAPTATETGRSWVWAESTDETLVVAAKYAGALSNYNGYIDGLIELDKTLRDLTARIN